MTTPRIVLASTSAYRADLLRRLVPAFEQASPGVDEDALDNESPQLRAERLAQAKAQAVASAHPDSLIIGSDQVADLSGHVLDKPGDSKTACEQLRACSARTVHFHTAVCVIDTRDGVNSMFTHRDLTRVHFRPLTATEIKRYVEREQPIDCAGSFKCESLGISLFEQIETSDPTALVGMPLIALSRLLRTCGLDMP